MADRFADELFSAYLDNEATPLERAAVDKRIDESADARRLLAELSELSRELQSLPRRDCPNDFADFVMRAVAVAPRGGSCQLPSQSKSNRSWQLRPRRAGLLRYGSVLTATVAALLVVVGLLNPNSGPPMREVSTNSPGEAANPSKTTVAGDVSLFGKRDPDVETASVPAGADNRRLAKRFDLGSQKLSALPRDPLVPPIAMHVYKKGDGTSGQGLVFIDNLRKLSGDDVGRVVTAIEHSPRGIAIVKLTVIDCREGLCDLQLLLSRNRISSQHGPSAGPAAASQTAATKDGDSQRLVAVYVQSTSERLASVMSELRSNAQFRRLQVDPPISPQRLDPNSQHQIAMLDAMGREGFSAAGGGKRRGRFALDATLRKGKAGALPSKSEGAKYAEMKKKTAPRENGRRDKFEAGNAARPALAELDRISRQLQLTIPAGLLAAEAKGGVAQRNAVGRQASRVTAGGINDKKSDAPAPTTVRPLRVLFVLVCPPAARTPAAPAARKSGS
jgi:hypothetical protein